MRYAFDFIGISRHGHFDNANLASDARVRRAIVHRTKAHPEIEFKWFERGGLQFQVQFINKEFVAQQGLQKSDGAIDGAAQGYFRRRRQKGTGIYI